MQLVNVIGNAEDAGSVGKSGWLPVKVTLKLKLAAVVDFATVTVAPLNPAARTALCMLAAVPVRFVLSKLIAAVVVAPTVNWKVPLTGVKPMTFRIWTP